MTSHPDFGQTTTRPHSFILFDSNNKQQQPNNNNRAPIYSISLIDSGKIISCRCAAAFVCLFVLAKAKTTTTTSQQQHHKNALYSEFIIPTMSKSCFVSQWQEGRIGFFSSSRPLPNPVLGVGVCQPNLGRGARCHVPQRKQASNSHLLVLFSLLQGLLLVYATTTTTTKEATKHSQHYQLS